MWSQLRKDMVEQILGDKCLDIDVVSHVTKYEYHPMGVQDLKEAVQPLKQAKKSWKQARIGDFEFDMPIPEMPPPERSNSWGVMIYFMYHPTKNIFKVEMYKHAMSVYGKYQTYNSSRQVYKFSRKDTTKEDLDTDTFLYYLRDMMGIYFTKLKHTQVCGRLVDNYSKTHKLMCGYNVKTKGAMCQYCRNTHLKRKFNTI